MTVVEGHVAPEQWATLEQAYQSGTGQRPPPLIQSFLVHSTSEPTHWQILSVWPSREALEQMRRSVQTPGAILMFRSAGAEPTVSILDVAAHLDGQ